MCCIYTEGQFDIKPPVQLWLVGFVAVAVATDGAQRGVKDCLFLSEKENIHPSLPLTIGCWVLFAAPRKIYLISQGTEKKLLLFLIFHGESKQRKEAHRLLRMICVSRRINMSFHPALAFPYSLKSTALS